MIWRPFYFANLIVDPKDENKIFKPDGILLLSVNGGRSFSAASGGAHGDFHDVWIDPANPNVVYTGDDGGLWSSRKVSNWMAEELGLISVAPQRGWEALKAIGWSIQKPRPKNPKSATPEEAAAFKKSSRTLLPKRPRSTPASRSRSLPRTSIASA